MHLSRSSALLVLVLAACPGPKAPSSPKCPVDRTWLITGQDDVEALAGCTTASAVTIRSGATITLGPLRSLETITGDLMVGPTVGMEELSLLELREVGGSIRVVANGSLRGMFLPRLERAGQISVEGNAGVMTVSFPRLATVTGSFVVAENGSLELMDLSALVTVGKDLVITQNNNLALVEADKLTKVLELRIEDNRSLPVEQVDALRLKVAAEP
jgi:hypothetical protein